MRMRAWSRLSGDDDGFTLLELTVAMIVIAVVVMTLVGLQLSELKTVASARQRQAATALADQKLERLRALPYSTIQAGLLSTDATLTSDTKVVSGRLGSPWNEAVVTSSTQAAPELVPHTQTSVLNGITYTIKTYVTHPLNDDGTDSNSAVDFWLTVVTSWSSSSTGGHLKSVAVRTRAAYPAGCNNGTTDHPYAGPCQPFLYGTAGRTNGGISITAADPSTPPITGMPFTSASVVFSNYSSEIGVEQTTSAGSKAFASGIKVDNTTTGQDATAANADIDPATATTTGPFNTAVPTSSSTSTQISGTNALLTLLRTGVATGSAVQAAVASTSAGGCQDLAGSALATNQACAASQLGRVDGNEADLDLGTIGGRDLPAFALASMQPDATAARSYAARFLTGAGGHCTGTSGDGCVGSGASRVISSFLIGSLPAGDGGDTLPSGFSGMVTGSSYSDSATAEAGINSAATGTTNFTTTRSGTVRYWNGSSYQTVNLATSGNYTLGATTGTYWRNGSPSITIAMSGVLTVTAPSTVKNTPANCQPTACTSKSNAGSIVADVTYQISSGGSPIAYFTVDLNLGQLVTSATYRAVPSA